MNFLNFHINLTLSKYPPNTKLLISFLLKGASTYKKMHPFATGGCIYVKHYHSLSKFNQYFNSNLTLKTTKALEIKDFTLYQNFSFNMAAGEGFEPSQNDPESFVLPLHNPAMFKQKEL